MSKNETDIDNLAEEIGKKLPDNGIEVLDKLEEYELIIRKMAHKYKRTRVEYEDLIQEALIGLILACRHFNPERTENPDGFRYYAVMRIRGKMFEYSIKNSTPITVPAHVAKTVSYVHKMNRILDKDPFLLEFGNIPNEEIVAKREHPLECKLERNTKEELGDLKQKVENIANNSLMDYERLIGLAQESISMMVSDEVLSKYSNEDIDIREYVQCKKQFEDLRSSLGKKRFMVFFLHLQEFSNNEIAGKLFEEGFCNREGSPISRQAVKAILDDVKKALREMKRFKRKEND